MEYFQEIVVPWISAKLMRFSRELLCTAKFVLTMDNAAFHQSEEYYIIINLNAL